MNDHLCLKTEILELLRDAAALATRYENSEVARRLSEAARRLQDEVLYVVVCGEAKRGKSSLINAFLEDPDLCKPDLDPTTCLVTLLRHGPREKFTVVLGERGQETTREVSRGEVADYVTEQRNPRNRQGARLVLAELPNPKLRDGLVIVDTPGVGGLNRHHTDVTYALLPEADAVLFVGDVTAPFSVQELEFAELVHQHCPNVLYVINKIDRDQGRDLETIAAENRQKLAATLKRPAESFRFLPVSSQSKLDYLQSHDARDLESSGFAALEQELWRLLGADRGRVLLASALAKLGAALQELHTPLEAELQVCAQQNREQAEQLEKQWQAAVKRLEELQEGNAAWRSQLGYELDQVGAQLRHRLETGFRDIRRNADKYQQKLTYLQAPDRLVRRLQAEVSALTVQLGKELNQRAQALHTELVKLTGLNLKAVPKALVEAPEAPYDLPRQGPKGIGWWDKTITVGRQTMFTTGALAALGGLVGAGAAVILLPAASLTLPIVLAKMQLGALLGAVGGKAMGLANGLRSLSDAETVSRRQQVGPLINHFLEDNQLEARHALGESQRQVQRALVTELSNQVLAERKVCEATLRSIQQARNLPPAQAQVRVPQLTAKLEELDRLNRTAGELAGRIPARPAEDDNKPPADEGGIERRESAND